MRSLVPMLVIAAATVLHGADFVLTVEGVSGPDGVPKPALQLTLADLAAMPRTTTSATVGGRTHELEGVLVYEILKKAGQPLGDQLRKSQLVRYALFTAHDGYRVLFALPEFDPAFTPARALLADRMDGGPLPAKKGPLWLVLPGEKSQARSVYMVERIELQSAREPSR